VGVSSVTVKTPARRGHSDPGEAPSAGYWVAPILLWIGAVVVGLVGALVIFSFTVQGGTDLDLWFLVLAVPFGVLLGSALVMTRLAKGHRAGAVAVFLLSLAAAIALHGIVGLLGQQRTRQAAAEACSVEVLAVLEAQSFYSDTDGPPGGTAFGSCYVMLTIDQTGPPAWADLEQLLLDNGWQHPFEPDWVVHDAGMYQPFQWLEQDDLVLYVHPEGAHDLPLDDFRPTDDGATTFALDIQPRP
jgi:hypothetical protein